MPFCFPYWRPPGSFIAPVAHRRASGALAIGLGLAYVSLNVASGQTDRSSLTFSETGQRTCRGVIGILDDDRDDVGVQEAQLFTGMALDHWMLGYITGVAVDRASSGEILIRWDESVLEDFRESVLDTCRADASLRWGDAVESAADALRSAQSRAGTANAGNNPQGIAGNTAEACSSFQIEDEASIIDSNGGISDPEKFMEGFFQYGLTREAAKGWLGGILSSTINYGADELQPGASFDLGAVESEGLDMVETFCEANPRTPIIQAIQVISRDLLSLTPAPSAADSAPAGSFFSSTGATSCAVAIEELRPNSVLQEGEDQARYLGWTVGYFAAVGSYRDAQGERTIDWEDVDGLQFMSSALDICAGESVVSFGDAIVAAAAALRSRQAESGSSRAPFDGQPLIFFMQVPCSALLPPLDSATRLGRAGVRGWMGGYVSGAMQSSAPPGAAVPAELAGLEGSMFADVMGRCEQMPAEPVFRPFSVSMDNLFRGSQ